MSSSSSLSTASAAAKPAPKILGAAQLPFMNLPPEDRARYIAAHSLLQRPIAADWSRHLNTKLMAQIHNGTDISGTTLEGMSLQESSQFFLDYLKAHSREWDGVASLFPQLEQMIQFCELDGASITKQILDLPVGQELLLPGGWSERAGGHAMLYLFQKQASGNFNILVFNMGAGGQFHASQVGPNWKDRIQPVVCYQEVPKEELSLPNPDFFDVLARFRVDCPVNKDQAQEIYNRLFGNLQDKIHPCPIETLLVFMDAQKSGTCAFSVLKAYLLWKLIQMGPFDAQARLYKRIHFFLKEETLAAFFQKGKLSETDLLFMKEDARNLSRSVVKWMGFPSSKRKEILSQEEGEIAFCTALDLLEQIETMERAAKKENLVHKVPLPALASFISSPELIKDDLEGLLKKMQADYTKKNAQLGLLTLAPSALPNINTEEMPAFVRGVIGQVNEIAKTTVRQDIKAPENRSRDYPAALTLIEQAAQVLPVPKVEDDPFWDKIPVKDIPSCLENLDELLCLYSQIAAPDNLSSPKAMNTAFAITACIHKLAMRQEKELFGVSPLKEMGIDIDHYLAVVFDPYHITIDPKDYEKRQELLRYFQSVKGRLFDFKNFSSLVDKERKPESDYLKALLQSGTPAAKQLQERLRAKVAEKIKAQNYEDFDDDTLQTLCFAIDMDYPPDPKFPGSYISILRRSLLQSLIFTNRIGFFEGYGMQQGSHHLPEITEMKISMLDHADIHYGLSRVVKPIPKLECDAVNIQLKEGKETRPEELQNQWARGQLNHRQWRSGYFLNEFVKTNALLKRRQQVTESQVMLDFKQEGYLPFDKMLAAINAEPRLMPSKILYLLANNTIDPTFPDMQLFFDLLFFKPCVAGNEESVPLFDFLNEEKPLLAIAKQKARSEGRELENEDLPPLLRLAADVVQKGLDQYFHMQPSHKPDVYTSLFFIRLAQRLTEIIPDCLPEKIYRHIDESMNAWLKLKTLPVHERCLIQLHRAYDGVIGFAKTPKEKLRQILVGWCAFNKQPIPEERKEKSLVQAVQTFLYSHAQEIQDILRSDPKFANEMFSDLFTALQIRDGFGDTPWKEEGYPLYTIQAGPQKWQVNLFTAKIACDGSAVQEGQQSQINAKKAYIRLFGSDAFTMTQTGNLYHFIHPELGTFEINPISQDDNIVDVAIRRKDPKSETWYQYIPPDQLEGRFPLPLIFNHSHWFPVGNPDQIVFLDLLSWKQVGIVDAKNPSKVNLANGNTVCNRDVKKSDTFLHKMEIPDWIRIEERDGKLAKVLFPYVHSLQGKALGFKSQDGKLFWDDNLQYHLAERQRGLLKKVDNYLVIESKEKRKILVPLKPLNGNNEYTREASLNLNKKELDNLTKWGAKFLPVEVGHFLEFDLDKNRPIALNTEGELFLAYLDLGNKEYASGVHRLKMISKSETFSPQSVQILSWIAKSPIIDKTPNACALRCRAALMLIEWEERWCYLLSEEAKKTMRMESSFIAESIGEDFKRYVKSISHVDAKLRLSLEEELKFVQLFQAHVIAGIDGKFLKKREEFLRSFQMPRLSIKKGDEVKLEYCLTLWDGLSDRLEAFFKPDLYGLKYYPDPADLQKINLGQPDPAKPATIAEQFGQLFAEAKKIRTEQEYTIFAKKLQMILLYPKGQVSNGKPENLDLDLFMILHFNARYHLFPPHRCQLPELPDDPRSKEAWIKNVVTTFQCKSGLLPADACQRFGARPPSKIYPSFPGNVDPITTNRLPLAPASMNLHKAAGGKLTDLLAKKPIAKSELLPLLNEHFIETPKVVQNFSGDLELTPSDRILPEDEDFRDAFKAELADFQGEYLAGIDHLQRTSQFTIKEGSLPKIRQSLEAQKKKLKKSVLERQRAILFAVNDSPDLYDKGLRLGGVKKTLTMRDLKNLMLLDSRKAFADALPPGFDSKIPALLEDLIAYESELITLKQVKRALIAIEKGEMQDLAYELKAETHYDPHADLLTLIFEDRANLKVRADQLQKIQELLRSNKGQYFNTIIQMMMGGGKTAILAAMLLYVAAKEGRLSLFVVPSAQFESVKQNLISSQKKIFNQDIFAMDVAWKDLTVSRLRWIKKQITEAREQEQFVLIRQESVQALEAELFAECYDDATTGTGDKERIALLQEILKLTYEQGDAIVDEIDLAMNSDKDLNRPVGPMKKMDAASIDLFGEVTRLLVSDKIRVGAKTINELVRLRENKQSLLDIEFFKKEIRPEILKELLTYAPLKLDPQDQEAFFAYVTGTMPRGHPFAKQIDARCKNDDTEIASSGQLIALLRGLFKDEGGILLFTLTRSTGRHYGRNPNAEPGKVTPFLGVGTPATTEFASIEEVAVLQLATAVSKGVTEAQIQIAYKKYRKAAEHFAVQAGSIEKTAEAIKWKAMTGIALLDMEEDAGKMKQAALAINNGDVNNILEIEKDTIAEVVGSYSRFISSNSQNFISQFSTKRGFSGTPWNHVIYDASQRGDNLIPNKAVGGMITSRMMERASPASFHVVKRAAVDEFLTQAQKESPDTFGRVRAIIDVGGLLKNTPDNFTVAKQILEFYEHDDSIQYVLYFGRRNENETPDHLMMLSKADPEHPVFIGKTRKEDLEKHGIKLKNAFVYFDERHTEATDIPLMSNAICLKTVGKDVQTRSDSQASMRARKYLVSQECHYILLEDEMRSFIGDLPGLYSEMKKTPTAANARKVLRSILLTQNMNQAKRKAQLNARAFRHKIDNALRKKARDKIFQNNLSFSSFQDVIVTKADDLPYDKFGAIKEPVKTKKLLQEYADLRIQSMEELQQKNSLHVSNQDLEDVRAEINLLKQEIEESPYLPKMSSGCFSELGTEMKMERSMMVNKEDKTEQDTDRDRLRETQMDRYRGSPVKDPHQETVWKEEDVMSPDFPKNPDCPPSYPVTDLFNALHYYNEPFENIFDADLLITDNLAHTVKSVLPVFQDVQKSADQVLVIAKEGKVQLLLLSIKETKRITDILKKNRPQDMWLIYADGREITSHPHRPLTLAEETQFKNLLLQANIFNGAASYLDQKSDEMRSFLKRKDRDLVLSYLEKKVNSRPNDKKIFKASQYLLTQGSRILPQRASAAAPPIVAFAAPVRGPRLERKGDRDDD